eukprot:TRINITY_DN7442_c0_g1_i1.p1 TRINITY_DN7442_c0_g1~~TRINITY_DN7442_c0_g1_i1.p1  ORF type:complete len:310 (-),score=115.11 TRINITY_DN7442_c0_g1_i1:187-1116(-)
MASKADEQTTKVLEDEEDEEDDDGDFVPSSDSDDDDDDEGAKEDDAEEGSSKNTDESKSKKRKSANKRTKSRSDAEKKRRKLKSFTSTSGITVEEDEEDAWREAASKKNDSHGSKAASSAGGNEAEDNNDNKSEIEKVWEEMNNSIKTTATTNAVDTETIEQVSTPKAVTSTPSVTSLAAKILQSSTTQQQPSVGGINQTKPTTASAKGVGLLSGAKRPSFGSSLLQSSSAKQTKKLTTMELSRQKWNSFKTESEEAKELTHELGQHVKSNNSFLEKVSFLQRTDLRQFEHEKELRNKVRTTFQNNKSV